MPWHPDEALKLPSLCHVFQETAAAGGDLPALRAAGDRVPTLSWSEYAEQVRALATGMAARGVKRGDAVALLLRNVREFHIADTALMHLGATPFSIHMGEAPERIAKFIAAAGAQVLVCEPGGMELVSGLDIRPETVVVTGSELVAGADVTLEDLQRETAESFDFDATWRAVGPEDIATLLYTSGTTGEPKGVQMPHRAVQASLAGYGAVASVTPNGRVLSYLPASHIADRFGSHYASIAFGHTVTCVCNHEELYDEIRAVRPTHFLAVPRVLEKLGDAARTAVARLDLGELAEAETRRLRVEHDEHGGYDARKPRSSEFAAVREAIGLDEAEWLTVGSAPSSRPVLEFLGALGLPFADIWGMTEIIVSTMNPPERIRFGSIGRAQPGVELRTLDDGELLVRGENRFAGYRNDPERTREVLDDDGWIHSGDLASIDADGYVAIVGRKKEMMINAAGKNLSPVLIESALRGASALIDQAAAIGDARRYVAALLALDGRALRAFADAEGLSGTHAELTRNPAVLEAVTTAVDAANATLPRVEQVRSWSVVETEWHPGGEEMTATTKLKRPAILAKYADEIEALYAGRTNVR